LACRVVARHQLSRSHRKNIFLVIAANPGVWLADIRADNVVQTTHCGGHGLCTRWRRA